MPLCFCLLICRVSVWIFSLALRSLYLRIVVLILFGFSFLSSFFMGGQICDLAKMNSWSSDYWSTDTDVSLLYANATLWIWIYCIGQKCGFQGSLFDQVRSPALIVRKATIWALSVSVNHSPGLTLNRHWLRHRTNQSLVLHRCVRLDQIWAIWDRFDKFAARNRVLTCHSRWFQVGIVRAESFLMMLIGKLAPHFVQYWCLDTTVSACVVEVRYVKLRRFHNLARLTDQPLFAFLSFGLYEFTIEGDVLAHNARLDAFLISFSWSILARLQASL